MKKEFRDWLEEKKRDSTYSYLNNGKLIIPSDDIEKELDLVIKKYDELSKPVVIPKYVADWIEINKGFRSISWLLNYLNIVEYSHELTLWCFESGNDDNLHKLARAWLDGYEVEEEQRYYALDSDDIPLLERVGNQIQRATTELNIYEKGRDNSRFKLTEQEIKGYDKRYWPFAEPAEQADFRLSF